VALVNYGELSGSLVVIVDVVDQSRALIAAPGIARQQILFRRLKLTDLKVEITRCPKPAALEAALKEADIAGKWAKSNWGKKLAAHSAKRAMTDLDRYKSVVLRSKRAAAIRDVLAGKPVPKKPAVQAPKAKEVDINALPGRSRAAVHAAAAGFFRKAGL